MGFDWIIFGAALGLLLYGTVLLGGAFALFAWVDVFDGKWGAHEGWRIPTSVYPFSLLVVWDLGTIIILHSDALMQLSPGQHGALSLILVSTSLMFLFATRFFVRQNSGPGTSLVSLGSKILAIVSPVLFVLMILGMPSIWK
jgi:hypothetical protein